MFVIREPNQGGFWKLLSTLSHHLIPLPSCLSERDSAKTYPALSSVVLLRFKLFTHECYLLLMWYLCAAISLTIGPVDRPQNMRQPQFARRDAAMTCNDSMNWPKLRPRLRCKR